MTGAYSYTIDGPAKPGDVENFTVNQLGDKIFIRWSNNSDSATTGYNVYYSEQGFGIGASKIITLNSRATEITTTDIPPGDWTFWINAVNDISGQTSENAASYDFTVQNYNTVLYERDYVPLYSGSMSSIPYLGTLLSHLVRHWTGKIIPTGRFACNNAAYDQQSAPNADAFEFDTVPGGAFAATTYYFTFTTVTPSGETLTSTEAVLNVDAGYLPTVFNPSPVFSGWNIYASTTSGAETKQNTSILSPLVFTANSGSVRSEQVWQMPITGMDAGASMPSANTTGWDVFNVFSPDCDGICQFNISFSSDTILDTGAEVNKRVWLNIDKKLGPGEISTPESLLDPENFFDVRTNLAISPYAGFSSAPAYGIPQFIIGQIEGRYLSISFEWAPVNGSVFYINAAKLVADNLPVTTAIDNVAISSSGTTINFSDYGLGYHQPPNVQLTPSSGSAIAGRVSNTTSSNTVANLSNGVADVSGIGSFTITGI